MCLNLLYLATTATNHAESKKQEIHVVMCTAAVMW